MQIINLFFVIVLNKNYIMSNIINLTLETLIYRIFLILIIMYIQKKLIRKNINQIFLQEKTLNKLLIFQKSLLIILMIQAKKIYYLLVILDLEKPIFLIALQKNY